MSMIDDARVLLQDVVAPDLKAISARLDALEHTVTQRFDTSEKSNDRRFEAIVQRFDTSEKNNAQRFDASEKANIHRFDSINQRFVDLEKSIRLQFEASEKSNTQRFDMSDKLATLRHESTMAAVNAHQEAILKALNIDRRMEQLEAIVAARNIPAQQEERQSKSA